MALFRDAGFSYWRLCPSIATELILKVPHAETSCFCPMSPRDLTVYESIKVECGGKEEDES